MRDPLTADPDEISTRTRREDERRAAEDESGTTSAPTGAERRPYQRQRSAEAPHERRRQHPETAPPPLASQPRRRSQLSQPRRSGTGTAHDTPRPSLLSPPRPKHRTRRQIRHFSPLTSQPRTTAATVSRSHSALIQPRPPLDISEMCKKRNDHTPHKRPIFGTFQALDGNENGSTADGQISLMRRINRRSTEPQRSGATFTFALNPGRAVALLGYTPINSFWNYFPRTPLTPKHVQPP